jgi:hypothetical protein
MVFHGDLLLLFFILVLPTIMHEYFARDKATHNLLLSSIKDPIFAYTCPFVNFFPVQDVAVKLLI